MKKDYLKIKEWAEALSSEYKQTIREYIAAGWDKKTAIEKVLDGSTIGAGYKAQIRYDLKGD